MGKYEPKDWKSIESGKKPLSGNVTDRVVEDYMAHHGEIKSPKISGRVFTSPRKRMGGSVPKKRGGSKPTLDDMQRDHADAVRNYGKTGAKVPKARKATAIREATTNAAEDYVNSLDLGKAEEKEQAMDQEEDLEELTDGELEEIEKRFEGIKRKLRNVKTRLNDVYEKDHPLETPKLTEGGAKVLAEAESKVDDKKRLESREQQSMYKSNKVPKKVRPESPNKDNNYQTQLDKPIQWKALKDKVQVKKTWETWLENKADTQTRRSQNPRTSIDGESVDNTHAGKTELPDTFGNLAYGSYKRNSPTDTDKRIKLRLEPHRPKIGRPKGDRGVENKLTRDQAKIQSDSLVHQMYHDPEGFKKRVGLPTGEKPEPDVHKKPQSKEPPREEPEWAKRSRAGGGKPQLRGKAEKYVESEEDKINATKLNEKRAIREGKVKPPTPKHLVKPTWKAWLEKDQGQGDARYANPHETGMEDPRKLQVTRDDFDMEDEKDEDNKPYKERDHKSE
tara:strand:+ start:4420 stop:5934 length:1515 start_codon:yes stop_codon:yes gene_type:complete